jgi:hypothetical protein
MYKPVKYLLIKMQTTLDTFNELIANLNDPRSSDTGYAMRMLNIHNPNDIPTLIGLRMQYHQYPFFNSVNRFMFNQAESERVESAFAATVPMLDPKLWVAFVTATQKVLQMDQQRQQQQQQQQIENDSRMLEQSPAPPSGRPTPMMSIGHSDPDLATIEKRIVDIFNTPHAVFPEGEDETTAEYKKKYHYYMIMSNLMNTHKKPIITPEEYARLFGDVFTDELLQPVVILLTRFNTKFPLLNADESLAFACRAYIDANQDIIDFLISLEQEHPKTFYVIARLMHSYATNDFDRNFGNHLGGKSRSKKRGRKSVHRRKKSAHNKRR